eukprot:489883-Hanusia_phi.AAC.2
MLLRVLTFTLLQGKLNVKPTPESQTSTETGELDLPTLNQFAKEAWPPPQDSCAYSENMKEQQQTEGQHSQMGSTLYAKEEALGLRPKSRRGRGIRSREYEEDAHRMAEEAPMMGDDEESREMQGTVKYEPNLERVEYKDSSAGSSFTFDEATGARPKSRRGRGMYMRSENNYMGLTGGDNLVGEAPQLGDDERSHMSDLAQVPEALSENNEQPTAGGVNDQFLPKIDEARGVRPPTRRGRVTRGRASQRVDDVDARQYSEAGNEIFSDCTTPDAPEEVDAMVVPPGAEGMEDGENHHHHVHHGADSLSQVDHESLHDTFFSYWCNQEPNALDENHNGKVKVVTNG